MTVLRSIAAVLLVLILSTGMLTLTTPAGDAQGTRPLARLNVTSITPNVVGTDSADNLTVSGTLTNTSDRPLNNLEAIFQRGPMVDGEATAATAVRGDAPGVTDPIFKPLVPALGPGRQTPVTMQVTLRGPTSLQVSQPGSYPVTININAEPDGARPSRRVAESRFVLPVVSLPGARPAPPPQATPTTMLVPITDYPRIEQAPVDGPAVFTDDQLATSLAPGGRLDGLVQAADATTIANPVLGDALCFVIDPDLLDAVDAMRRGYQVRQPDGSLRPGAGEAAAGQWLGKLRATVRNQCVIALPYADADVVALARAGLPDVIKNSRDGAAVVQRLLDVLPRTDVAWPISGLLDQPSASDLADQGVRTMLLRPDNLAVPAGSLTPVRLKGVGTTAEPTVLPLDPLLSSAIDPQSSTALSPADNGTLSVESTLGALAYRASTGFRQGSTAVLAPPRRWALSETDLRALLAGMQRLTDAGYLKPTPMPGSSNTAPEAFSTAPAPSTAPTPTAPATPATPADGGAIPEVALRYPASAGPTEIPQPLLQELAEQNFKVGMLYQSTRTDTAANVDHAAVTTPLSDALLRATSSAWRGDQGASRDWLNGAEAAINRILSGIGLEQWDGTITLTSSNASIPVWVANPLPVTVDVSLLVSHQVGLDVKALGDAGNPLIIPPRSHRPFYLQTTALRAGQFSVDVTVVTANGNVKLGQTKRLSLENFAYGSLTIPLTVIAAALLVVLTIRRIARRMSPGRRRRATAPPLDENDPDGNPDRGSSPSAVTATMETIPIRQVRLDHDDGDPE